MSKALGYLSDVLVQTCPTTVVLAPPDRIWPLLTWAEPLARWSGTKVLQGPRDRALLAGDRLVLTARFGLKVIFDVRMLNPVREAAIDVRLPLGVVNRETIEIVPLEGARSRVSFG